MTDTSATGQAPSKTSPADAAPLTGAPVTDSTPSALAPAPGDANPLRRIRTGPTVFAVVLVLLLIFIPQNT
jgi:hypothetical protein